MERIYSLSEYVSLSEGRRKRGGELEVHQSKGSRFLEGKPFKRAQKLLPDPLEGETVDLLL